MKNQFKICGICLAAITFSVSTAYADISINGYTDDTNDRFTNSSSFIGNGYNLSGVGQTNGGTSGTAGNWATAISRNVVISAFHYRPDINETIYFYPDNDPSQTPITRRVVSSEKIANTDLWVGTLDSKLPAEIVHYVFGTASLSGPPPVGDDIFIADAGPYQDLNSFVFGKSPFNHNADPDDDRTSFNDQGVGRNLISGFSENVPFQGNSDNDSLILLNDAPGSGNFVDYEAIVRGGDSGAPLFVDINGELVLLGTNAFLLNNDLGFGVNYVGNQTTFLNSYILTAVPEPSGMGISIATALLLFSRRRR